jgi:putative CocE/NonD family hydrolase
MEWQPAGCIESINESGVPVYLWCGWFDAFTLDGLLMFHNFEAPRKIVMGAWPHSPRDPQTSTSSNLLYAIEQLRWFDYWLKGVDNNIMGEPAVRYHVMKNPGDNEWRSADRWPPPDLEITSYYFLAGPSRSVASPNDGILGMEPPASGSDRDEYTVDYSATTGQTTRWDNTVGGGFGYSDMTANDAKALTYTTLPLDRDVEVTGHPVVHLWISSTASDGDFFVYLEEVDGEGISHYVTEGTMRASHRALHPPPYDNFGLPYHRSFEEDAAELASGEPAELIFDLLPTSNVFNAGSRIRIAVTCADRDNAATPEVSPPPTVKVYRSAEHASRIVLPVVPSEKKE